MLSPAHNNANIANYFNSISICSYKLSPKRKLFLLFLYYYSWFSIGLYNLKPIERKQKKLAYDGEFGKLK